MRYWVNTVSRDHVQHGVDGGFTQAGHGKATGLKRMAKGDRIVFYCLAPRSTGESRSRHSPHSARLRTTLRIRSR